MWGEMPETLLKPARQREHAGSDRAEHIAPHRLYLPGWQHLATSGGVLQLKRIRTGSRLAFALDRQAGAGFDVIAAGRLFAEMRAVATDARRERIGTTLRPDQHAPRDERLQVSRIDA
ncbi:MAG: hypothetical protein A4S12_03565 [Proteobacteria bacterium SG_bin5]|nr:MAG: hypothetical protein A4S12_03565 [Proteobacteria bacterium SG_bin5]